MNAADRAAGALRPFARALRLLAPLALVAAAWTNAVTAAPQWHVVHGEFFDLYSNSGRAAAVDTATWIEQFRRTVGGIWSVGPSDISRATIIQFRNEREFEPYGSGKYNGGFFMRNEILSVMVFHDGGEDDAVRSLVQHEAVHWLLASKRGRLPAWVGEGLAEVYATFAMKRDSCRLFQADANNVHWLQTNGIQSLDALIAREPGEIDFQDPEMVRDFYAQAWALAHYLVAGEGVEEGGARLARYLKLVESGMSQRDAFEPAFGVDLPTMKKALSRYVTSGRYTILTIKFPRDALSASFVAEPAPAVEVECALGRALLAGRRDDAAAETRFKRARETAPESPLPYEGLAAVALRRGDRRLAAELFAAATERGSRNAFAYHLPATDELRDRLSLDPGPRDLRPVDARRLSNALIKALELDRNLSRAAYDLGQALLYTEPLLRSDVQFLARMESSAEDPRVVRYRLAGLLHRLGDARARQTLEMLTRVTDNDLLRDAARADLEAIDTGGARVMIGGRYVLKPRSEGPNFSIPISRQ